MTQEPTSSELSFWPKFWTAYKARILHPINLIVCTFGSIIVASIGPFNTYDAYAIGFRLAFWGWIVFSSSISSIFFGVLAQVWFEEKPFWYQSSVGAAIFAPTYFLIVWFTITGLFPQSELPHPLVIFTIIVSISAIIYVIMWSTSVLVESKIKEHLTKNPIEDDQTQTVPSEPIQSASPTTSSHSKKSAEDCPFMANLGPNAGKRLIRLAMSDHYIEAHTETGMHLLHMRFSDAVKMLDTDHGAQVHRSHWVRFDEIAKVKTENQKTVLVMADGFNVPVSRSRKKNLKERGVI